MLRASATTEKGNLGEDLLHKILIGIGYLKSRINENRKGDWDVIVQNGSKEVKFEVKLGSLDTNGNHQFNGIRHDTLYTHLFLLGVLPYELKYKIIPKRDLGEYKLVPCKVKQTQHLSLR